MLAVKTKHHEKYTFSHFGGKTEKYQTLHENIKHHDQLKNNINDTYCFRN